MDTSTTTVLITGANSGIGFATAKRIACASPDYHVIICSRNINNGEAARAEIEKLPNVKGTLYSLQLDVNDDESIAKAVEFVTAKFSKLDVMVNNAAIASRASSTKVQLQETFATNVVGATLVCEAFTPLLLKSPKPYILHVSSGLGSLNMSLDTESSSYAWPAVAYRMSKAALNMLATQHHKDLAPKGVKVFVVNPGLVESNLRGKDEASRKAGGLAIPADDAGQFLLNVVQGKRDEDVGKFIHADGAFYKMLEKQGHVISDMKYVGADGVNGIYPW